MGKKICRVLMHWVLSEREPSELKLYTDKEVVSASLGILVMVPELLVRPCHSAGEWDRGFKALPQSPVPILCPSHHLSLLFLHRFTRHLLSAFLRKSRLCLCYLWLGGIMFSLLDGHGKMGQHGPLTWYVKLGVGHAPGMEERFSPRPTLKETAS